MKFRTLMASAMMLGCLHIAQAQDCQLDIMVTAADNSDAPAELDNMLQQRLMAALNAAGATGDSEYGQLYLAGRFTDMYKDVLPGPPMQTAVHSTLTLYVADVMGGKVFDSQTFDLRGVGTSEERAYINAVSQIAGRDTFRKFISRASSKTIDYFDKNYRQLLAKAESAAARRDFDQALYYTTLIPSCSVGYPEAEAMTRRFFQAAADQDGQRLLLKAKGVFAAQPNQEGATKAYALLAMINPDAACYGQAMKFADEVAKTSKAEYSFENHKKYQDAIDKDKARIEAAKQIGVAFGRGQKSSTTNILWK